MKFTAVFLLDVNTKKLFADRRLVVKRHRIISVDNVPIDHVVRPKNITVHATSLEEMNRSIDKMKPIYEQYTLKKPRRKIRITIPKIPKKRQEIMAEHKAKYLAANSG